MQASSVRQQEASSGEATERRRVLVAGGVVFALVFLIALGSSRSAGRLGGPGRVFRAGGVGGDLDLALLLLGLITLAAVASVFSSGLRWRRRRDDEFIVERPEIPWWEKALLVTVALVPAALVISVIVVAREGSHHSSTVRRPALAPGSATPSHSRHGPTTAAGHSGTPTVHWLIWMLVAAVVLVTVVALALRRRSRVEPGTKASAEASSRALQAVIQESLDDLERETDPRRAVIRAYSGMERELAGHGFGRQPSEAPLEYLARSLSVMRVSRNAGERLTALFQRARFSEHTIDEAMKRQAITALTAVRDELAEGSAR